MSLLRRFLLVAVGAILLSSAPANASPARNDVQADTPDALEMMAAVEYAVAIRDTNENPAFKCLTAKRSNFDAKASSATYVWSLNAGEGEKRKNATFQYVPGDSPNTARVVVNSDTIHPDVVSYPYTDFKSCAVMEVNFRGHHCMLWALDEAKDSVNEECLRKHAEICGQGVALYDRDTCTKSRV
uniref:Lipocalin/cytosolic fatty-acid binding domain-containing protein n=1 Tax=Amblyomma maculatum TaxID=34609 RepID=G3MQ08_AMBMU